MEVKFHPPQFLINIVRGIEGQENVESDFLLRAIRVKNTAEKPVHITRYCFDLKSEGKSQKKISYPEEMVKKRSLALLELKEKLMTKRRGIKETLRKGNLLLLMGTEKFWDKDQISTNTLEPNQETGFLHEHFRIATPEPIDELVFTAVYVKEDKQKNVAIRIPVTQYERKNQYIFPLKGIWMVLGNWNDPYDHRTHNSQEFGFDLIQLDDNMQFVQNQEKPNDEYPCYGQKIVAIADGEVVDCLDGSPENPSACALLPKERKIKLLKEQGLLALANGNFVVLEHHGGEFSFYGHMKPGLQVNKGDKVKQGQTLGKVGNSGNSTGPHLHFQLMDAPSILTGRGLPCYFTNVRDLFGERVEFVEHDGLIVHLD
ncbi:MAG: M23 family metallopeptidase [Candidatus Bathyarchaeota archaeon]|nr:MAG: M23 family metallopeptidase [Candidatus Bathyarchaeota archaeon]